MKILVVDDHMIVRRGLLLLLTREEGFKEVFEADNGREALQLVGEKKPDVVVMDMHMPQWSGIEATREIRAKYPSVKIIMLTNDPDRRYIKEAFRAGASGYLLKDCAVEELVLAIRTVQEGKVFLSSTISSIVMEDYFEKPAAASSPLTTRETEILRLVAEGLTTKEIAVKMNSSVRTVEAHRHAISEKTGAASIAEMTRYAIRLGLVKQ